MARRGRGHSTHEGRHQECYRNVPVHPEDRWLTGMKWRDRLFVDSALPFGLSSVPNIFMVLADAAELVIRRTGAESVVHYLDDSLVMGAPRSQECSESLNKLLSVFQQLGFPVAPGKLEGLTSCLVFLGFELPWRSGFPV